MLAFEELLRTKSANPINVGFEREFVVGVWFTTKPPVALLQNILLMKQMTLLFNK